MSKLVVLGLSGGVDSSVSAAILKEQGYNVIGVFMKNWDEKNDLGVCTAQKDYSDALEVAAKLDIPIQSVNFEKEYWDNVFTYFLDEYKRGNTPNPDILCNQEIKFKCFLEYAMELNADYIAMGHYAQVKRENNRAYLLKGYDNNKDQSYFLSRISEKALQKTLFPIGDLEKSDVRKIAQKYDLITANKKDSTGICFIGERNFNKFLDDFLLSTKGNIIDIDTNEIVGEHTGLIHYTIGQRKGMGIGGTIGGNNLAYFVCKKDLKNNILYVAKGSDNPNLYSSSLIAKDMHFINGIPEQKEFKCKAKFRYRQTDQDVLVKLLDNNEIEVIFDKKQKSITPAQVVVLYDDNICLGGGFINKVFK